ncbi:hypothetical protein B0H11DRAFT_2090248 [Mycena galericulata]|nr:hypothetical protein B0H11DRAFT_2090248 [Mycena galericulata]
MSPSFRKERCVWLGIHKAPYHLSTEEFKARIEKFVEGWLALSVVRNTTLKVEMILTNDLLTPHAKADGIPIPLPGAIVTSEFGSPDHIMAVASDPAVKQFIGTDELFKPDRAASVFSAQIRTKVIKPGSKDRLHSFGILKVPQYLTTENYARKFEEILGRLVALPAIQKCLLKYTLLLKGKSNENQLLGLPNPERTIVMRLEFEVMSIKLAMSTVSSFA